MKIQASRIEQFVKSPDPAVRAVLVYGPDSGLVRERIDVLTKTVSEDPGDPFLVVEIMGSALRDDPALLADEAAAIALMGGRRVVRIRDAADSQAAVFKMFFEDLPGDALVLAQGGDLSPRSALRKLFESEDAAIALPCYADDERSLDAVIQDTLKQDNVSITPDAVAYLQANLGTDRGQTRSELRKLALYAGDGAQVTLDDAMACVGDSSALTLDTLIYAAAGGDAPGVDRALARSYQEGINPVTILRAVGRHMLRLQLVRAQVDSGKRTDDAMKSLRPPVFFKMKGPFSRQVSLWRGAAIARALTLILDAETQCKETGMPMEAICGRTLLQIGRLAALRRNAAH
ncbi:MAG: DNA polymerase III subunit delta [Rhodospirillaceae bacterium]|jgi:DNA polymerase III subunit delta|nr:DNA polymerase III subunit delta [Rhodospirillaceae bacterium]MBT5666347.1 DNA polymerase III subunit delta [Rhodospirillaceae bacterium]MBT5808876.1 DNA polymerase III subunit delta [Rhodospirillaceae bacterium]